MNQKQYKEKHTTEKHNFETEVVWKLLLKIAMPLIFLMIANSLYIFLDSILAAKFVPNVGYGENSDVVSINGGVLISIIMPYALFLYSFSLIFVVGFSLYFSKRLGQNKLDSAEKGVGQAMMASLVMSFILIIFLQITASFYTSFLINHSSEINPEAKNEIIHSGTSYLRIISFSVIFITIANILIRGLRAENHIVSSSTLPLIPIPFNLFFDWLFMKHYHFGISGAAFATLLASIINLVFVLLYVFYVKKTQETSLNFKVKNWIPIKETLIIIAIFGLSSFIRRVGAAITVMFLSINITGLPGDEISWITIFTVSSRVGIFVKKTVLGTTQAAAILFAFYLGNKNKEKIKDTMKWSFIYSVVFQLILILFLIILNRQVFNLFIDENYINPETGKIDYYYIYFLCYIMALFYVFTNGLTYVISMFFAATRNIKGILVQTVVISLITISGSFIGFYISKAIYEVNQNLNWLLLYFVITLVSAILATSISWYMFLKYHIKGFFNLKNKQEIVLAQETSL